MRLKKLIHSITENQNRIFGLDLVRSLAILLVFWQHAVILIPNEFEEYAHFYKNLFLEGVSIFFVLSGFLISGILLKVYSKTFKFKKMDIWNFWLRRWLRTLPAYFVVLIVLIFFDYQSWEQRFSFFYFGANFFTPLDNSFFRVSWSLAVEEWFYILLPILLFTFSKIVNLKTGFLITILSVFIFSNLMKIQAFQNGLYAYEMRQVVVYRLDAICLGGFLAWLNFYNPLFFEKYKKPFLLIFVFLLILSPFINLSKDSYASLLSYQLEGLHVFLTIPTLYSIKTASNRFYSKTITAISKLSYSIYLTHASIVLWGIIRFLQQKNFFEDLRFEFQSIVYLIIYFFLTLILSVILYSMIEVKFMKIRDKITRKE